VIRTGAAPLPARRSDPPLPGYQVPSRVLGLGPSRPGRVRLVGRHVSIELALSTSIARRAETGFGPENSSTPAATTWHPGSGEQEFWRPDHQKNRAPTSGASRVPLEFNRRSRPSKVRKVHRERASRAAGRLFSRNVKGGRVAFEMAGWRPSRVIVPSWANPVRGSRKGEE